MAAELPARRVLPLSDRGSVRAQPSSGGGDVADAEDRLVGGEAEVHHVPEFRTRRTVVHAHDEQADVLAHRGLGVTGSCQAGALRNVFIGLILSVMDGWIATPTTYHLVVVAINFAVIVFGGYDLIVYGSTVPALLHERSWHLTPTDAGHIGSIALVGMFRRVRRRRAVAAVSVPTLIGTPKPVAEALPLEIS
jgi:hypothetical protein